MSEGRHCKHGLHVAEGCAECFGNSDDFRAHTCGECAWGGRELNLKDRDGSLSKGFYCRRSAWGGFTLKDDGCHLDTYIGLVVLDTPACPAYVPREVAP